METQDEQEAMDVTVKPINKTVLVVFIAVIVLLNIGAFITVQIEKNEKKAAKKQQQVETKIEN